MQGLLSVTSGPDAGQRHFLSPRRRMVLGRSQNADIQLTDPQVSRVHSIFLVNEDRVTVMDSGSISGTWVNGESVTTCELQPGDVIRVGGTQLTFQWSQSDERTTTLDDQLS